jgi:pyruvate dehydrogenase E2 component (dihydrolipoamide acetyltransferase)
VAELLLMPEVAAGATSAVLSTWPLAEASSYSTGEILAIIETDKAVVDVEAESDGVLIKLLISEGQEVQIGRPIALIAAQGEVVADVDAALSALGYSSDAAPTLVPTFEAESAGRSAAAPEGLPVASESGSGRIFASPLARRHARENDIDLSQVTGTGPQGRIRKHDLDNVPASAAPASASASAPKMPKAPVPAPGIVSEIPHSRLRRAIAQRLVESKTQAPHFYLNATMRVDRLMSLRAEINDGAQTRVSFNDFVIKAVAVAHQRVPQMNVIWTPDAILQYSSIDISMAVATENGLVTPTLRNVDTMTLTQIATSSKDFAQRAKDGKLRQSELEGGTTSVTNLGMFGVENFGAIINPPQSSIIAVGAITKVPVVENDSVVVGHVMQVTVSVDHRPIDGATGAQWLQAFVELMEAPAKILA